MKNITWQDMQDMMMIVENKNSQGERVLLAGVDVDGNPIFVDASIIPHPLLMGGVNIHNCDS